MGLAAWLRSDQTLILIAMGMAVAWAVGLLSGLGPAVRTPVDWPLTFILLWLPVNYWASADRFASIPAAANVLIGIAAFYLVLAVGQAARRPRWSVYLFLLVGAGLLLAVALVPDGLRGRLALPAPVLALARRMPDTVNANVLAGALLPAAVLSGGLILAPGHWLRRIGCALLLAASVAVMVLGASRGALLGLGAGFLAMLLILGRWYRLAGIVAAAGAGVAIWRIGLAPLLELLGKGGAVGSMAGRLEVWSRALYALQDFVFTGIGIGTFHLVIPLLYPYFTVGADTPVPHAHNLFLQIGADLGLPGLLAYATIIALSLWMTAVVAARYGGGWSRYTAAGVLGALIAGLSHGLVDAVLWGTRPAGVLWWLLGLAALLFVKE
jgi:putative inorganic carbon (HCO3(-)) transporter